MPRDALGNPVSGSAEAVTHLDDAIDRVLRHDGGPAQAAAAATRADPTFGLAHAVLAYLDPEADTDALLDHAQRLLPAGTDYEQSLVRFLTLLLTDGMWAAQTAGVEHARRHPRDLFGVGLAATIVERSTRVDVHEAVLATYAPSRRLLGDHPYLLCQVGFVLGEQGHLDEAGTMAEQALGLCPTSVTAAHLRSHVHYETADHAGGLAWLDDFRATMDPRGDYVHHLGWHAALHVLALGDGAGVLTRLAELAGPDCDEFRHVVDNGPLLMRCRLVGLLDRDEDPTGGRAGFVPDAWLARDLPSMYLAFHAAVGLAVQHRADDLRTLAARAARMATPGLPELLAPLATALADDLEGETARAVDGLLALHPTMDRWGGSRAQRDVVDDMLIDAAVRGGRPEVAAALLTERTQRRDNLWDFRALRTLAGR